MSENQGVITSNKLEVVGQLSAGDIQSFILRCDTEVHNWIKNNTKGSLNSVVNYLLKYAICEIEPLLEHDEIVEMLRPGGLQE